MTAKRLALASFIVALIAAAIAAFAPLDQVTEGTLGVVRSYRVSLFSEWDVWLLWLLSIPVLVALAGVMVRVRPARVISAILLWGFSMVGMWSIGLFFVPSAMLMTVAAARRAPSVLSLG